MNCQTLRAYLKARGWSQSELARRIGVSRQAVSLWFRSDVATVRSQHLMRVSEALGVAMDELVRPLPALPDEDGRLRATFLWDGLYPDIVDFAIAVGRWEPQAVGRFIQGEGIYAAEHVLGRAVWRRFNEYKQFIHPARRRQFEALIRWRERRTAN